MFLHFEAVGINPKLALGIEAIEHFEVDCDVFASSVHDWDRVQLHVEFDHVVEVLGEPDSDFGSLLGVGVLQIECPLLEQFAILVQYVLVYLREQRGSWLIPGRHENIVALAILVLHLVILVELQPVAPIFVCLLEVGGVVRLLTKILFDIDTKWLLNVFRIVGIVEGDVPLLGHAEKSERLFFGVCGILFVDWHERGLARFGFDKFDDYDLIYIDFAEFEIHDAIVKIIARFGKVLVFENVCFELLELL